jgi:hypothetical protein
MITADYDTLLRQAWMTAAVYMQHAATEIDAVFGKGYAAAHPELVAAFMRTAADDFRAASLGKDIGGALQALADAVDRNFAPRDPSC